MDDELGPLWGSLAPEVRGRLRVQAIAVSRLARRAAWATDGGDGRRAFDAMLVEIGEALRRDGVGERERETRLAIIRSVATGIVEWRARVGASRPDTRDSSVRPAPSWSCAAR